MTRPSIAPTPGLTLSRLVVVLSYLVVAFAIAFAVGTKMFFRAGNPYDISNSWNERFGWNPETNFVQVLVVIVLTPVLWWLLLLLDRTRPAIARVVVVLFASVVAFLSFVAPALEHMDKFHWGEQLAPSLAFVNGATPYTEIFVLHGMGEDVWRPALGFALFSGGEPSIGAYVLTTAISRGIAGVAFFLLLAWLMKSKPVFLAATIWFAASPILGVTYTKNLFIYAGVALLAFVFVKARTTRARLLGLGAFGLGVTPALLYSVDVGSILLALLLGMVVTAPFVEWAPDGDLLMRPPRLALGRFLPSVVLVAAFGVGQLLALLVLRPDVYVEFLSMTFVEIPRYQGLMWDYPIPALAGQEAVLWAAVFLAGLEGLAIVLLVRSQWTTRGRALTPDVPVAVVLWTISIVYFRFAVGRPDLFHYFVSLTFTFATAFWLMRPLRRVFPAAGLESAVAAIVAAVVLIIPLAETQPWQIFVNGTDAGKTVRAIVQMPSRPDDSWIEPGDQDLIEYIRDNTDPDDSIYFVEPEPVLYYETGRRNPTRFAISWFTDPAPYSQEVIADLEADRPALVVLDTGSEHANTDGITITERFPEVMDWIFRHYPNRVKVGSAIVLTP